MALTLNRKPPKKNLVYTMAFDAPQNESYRFLGRMLASSLLRTLFTGDIVIFRNSPAPLFLVERKGLDELIFVIGHWSLVIRHWRRSVEPRSGPACV